MTEEADNTAALDLIKGMSGLDDAALALIRSGLSAAADHVRALTDAASLRGHLVRVAVVPGDGVSCGRLIATCDHAVNLTLTVDALSSPAALRGAWAQAFDGDVPRALIGEQVDSLDRLARRFGLSVAEPILKETDDD